jgi:hypothetical protein
MNIYTFIKKDGNWQLQFSNHTYKDGSDAYVPLEDGADTMLNLLSAGENEVSILMEKEPFENADVLELQQTCEPFLAGGYYLLHEYNGKVVDYPMWLSDVPKVVFGTIPQKIYFKKSPWG